MRPQPERSQGSTQQTNVISCVVLHFVRGLSAYLYLFSSAIQQPVFNGFAGLGPSSRQKPSQRGCLEVWFWTLLETLTSSASWNLRREILAVISAVHTAPLLQGLAWLAASQSIRQNSVRHTPSECHCLPA